MQAVYYIFREGKILHRCNGENGTPLNEEQWQRLAGNTPPLAFIASSGDENTFTVELEATTELAPEYDWIPLRHLLGQVPDQLFRNWGRASQLLHWFKTHKFCGSCGSKTERHTTELAKICPDCESIFYPAISPCIIVSIIRDNKLLLARSPRFANKLFSTLAGFIEPGESAEDTVAREVFEEVSIRVKNIRYFKSQPWPFPGQLMLGFFAEYESGEIVVDGDEICEAHWYDFDDLPIISGPATIAGQLIRHHVTMLNPVIS